LKARELREYVAPRRYALVLAALRDARGRVLDDMTAMLLKFSRKVVWISQQRLAESHVEESTETGTLIAVLAEMLGFLAQDVATGSQDRAAGSDDYRARRAECAAGGLQRTH
jgi:hypothetical protein